MKVINQPISVISWTKKDGTLLPFKIRLKGEHEQDVTLMIDKILTTHKEKVAGRELIRFTCQIKIQGLVKLCELRYEKSSMCWSLFKI